MNTLILFRRSVIAALGLGAVIFGATLFEGGGHRQGAQTPSAARAKDPITLIPIDQRVAVDNFLLIKGTQDPMPVAQMIGHAPVLLHFWATWCGPCLPELPGIDRVAMRMGDRMQIMAVSMDRDGVKAARQFFDQHHLNALTPYGASADGASPQALPTSILLDTHGRVAWTVVGAHHWDGDDLEQAIARLTAEP